MTEVDALEYAMRDEFNKTALRRLAVLRPLKVVITNYPEGKTEELDAVNNPEDPGSGTRKVPFSRELFIEQRRFHGDAAAEIFPAQARRRSALEVRLHHQMRRSHQRLVGNVTELRCTADLESKSGGATSNRKIKGTIHWVSAAHAIDAEVRLYDRLFTVPEPDADGDFKSFINPRLTRSRDREMRTVVRRGEAGTALSIRAPRLLRARSGFPAWQARLQSDDHLARYLGEGRTK